MRDLVSDPETKACDRLVQITASELSRDFANSKGWPWIPNRSLISTGFINRLVSNALDTKVSAQTGKNLLDLQKQARDLTGFAKDALYGEAVKEAERLGYPVVDIIRVIDGFELSRLKQSPVLVVDGTNYALYVDSGITKTKKEEKATTPSYNEEELIALANEGFLAYTRDHQPNRPQWPVDIPSISTGFLWGCVGAPILALLKQQGASSTVIAAAQKKLVGVMERYKDQTYQGTDMTRALDVATKLGYTVVRGTDEEAIGESKISARPVFQFVPEENIGFILRASGAAVDYIPSEPQPLTNAPVESSKAPWVILTLAAAGAFLIATKAKVK